MYYALYAFWISSIILIYTYLGYGVLVFLLTKWKKTRIPQETSHMDLPHVTYIIAAYNESAYILAKIYNTLELDYPREKLDVFVVTDGSTDLSPDMVSRFDNIRLFHQPERKGKIHAVNRVMHKVDTPIVVFSDANTVLNSKALKYMVSHYQDPQVGGVSGEKIIVDLATDGAAGSGEGLYWKYESLLKKLDSRLYSMVGSAGELFSIRTQLYEAPPDNMIIEDFFISLKIVANGSRFAYEPRALATETASATVKDEWKRKVRISAGGLQAISKLVMLLNPFRFGVVTFQYISHRVLRWTLAPLALLVAFISNAYLAYIGLPIYQVLLVSQVSFYLLAGLGYVYRNQKVAIKGFFVPFYFTIMNASVYAGFFRFLFGRQSVLWEKTNRA
jgi:biofilm PGA synthesis N-glycosyltransferase PgaC